MTPVPQDGSAADRSAADRRQQIPKRLVVCSDGTGNSSAKLLKTNVWRLYDAIDLGPAPDSDPTPQLAFYDDGVGSSSFLPLAILGGAFGHGLARNVMDAYTFLCRHWNEGDELYFFGFSRGAFTIRILTGLIYEQGLIKDYGSESDLAAKVDAAYGRFRSSFADDASRADSSWLPKLGQLPEALLGRLRRAAPAQAGGDAPAVAEVKPKIAFVGVWDTVDAYGFPIEEMTRGFDKFVLPILMRDRKPAPCVERAVQILALDEERNSFHPVLWDERSASAQGNRGGPPQRKIAAENGHVDGASIAQVWFPGVHSDIGGGYANDRLAHGALMFMIERIDRARHENFGLRLHRPTVERYRALADIDAPLHDSRKGIAGYYRYLPRRFDFLHSLRPQESGASYDPSGPTDQNPDIPVPLVHESALIRIGHGAEGYAPIIMPTRYKVVLRGTKEREGCVVEPKDADTVDGRMIDIDPPRRLACQDRLWNWVWLRRVVYFATVFCSLWLAAMPFLGAGGPVDHSQIFSPVRWALDALQHILPWPLTSWIGAWRRQEALASTLFVAVGALLYFSAKIDVAIRDRMQRTWRPADGRVPDARSAGFPSAWLDDHLFRLRTSPKYMRFFVWLKTRALPTAFGMMFWVGSIVLALLAAAYVIAILIGLSSKTMFAARNYYAPVCIASTKGGGDRESVTIDPRSLCASTGFRLEAGKTYTIGLAVDDTWADAKIPADLYGLSPVGSKWRLVATHFVMSLGAASRRSWFAPWFALHARVGADGDDFWLDLGEKSPADRRSGLIDFRAERDGELFLFVNDAVPILGWWNVFYSNNHGALQVSVAPSRR